MKINLGLHIKRLRFGDVLRVGLSLSLVALLGGCATTREDDYVASVIAEAIRQSGAEEGSTYASQAQAGGRAPSSIHGPAVVSVAGGGAVSITPMGSVPSAQPVQVATVAPAQGAIPDAVVQAGAVASSELNVPAALTGSGDKATTVAPLKPGEPTIQPDTVLWVSVNEDPSLNGRYIVNNSSAIDFGYVGLVFLQDMTAAQAEQAIKNVLIGRYLNAATVAVKIAKASYDVVGVMGNVERPGEIKIGPGAAIALTEALRRAEGLKSNRDSNRVKIVRGGVRNPFGPAADGEVLPLVDTNGQMRVPDVYLRNNDLVYVFAAEAPMADGGIKATGSKRVLLLGEVPRRGVIEFAENEPCTLMHLLFKVGGLPRFANGDKIQIVRRQKDGSETTYVVDGESLMTSGNPRDDMVLESGDRVIVPSRKFAFF